MKVKRDHRSKFSNLSNWKEEAWKKSGLQRDSNTWPPRYRCNALPTELWKFTAIITLHFHLLPQYKYELFHTCINFTSFHCTGRYELNKLTSLPMCGFIAQLVKHRTGIAEVTGSNPVEALIFFRLFLSNCLNLKIYCDDHSSLHILNILYSAVRCQLSVQPISSRRFSRCAHCPRRSVLSLLCLNLAYLLFVIDLRILASYIWIIYWPWAVNVDSETWPWAVSVKSVSVSWQGDNWPWVVFVKSSVSWQGDNWPWVVFVKSSVSWQGDNWTWVVSVKSVSVDKELIDLEYCFADGYAAQETNSNELAETIQTATILWAHRDFAVGGNFVTSNSSW